MSGFEANYSRVDRMVHNLAMSQLEMQKSLSRLEDKIYKGALDGVTAADPVFVTSLPRAGTTLLLEIVAGVDDFAAHTYRHMPFVLAPQFWDKVSGGFRKAGKAQERAHGDGMLVDYDSVEAFEEVLWLAFWPEHFEKDRIRPWTADERSEDEDFAAFLRRHMKKIIALARARAGEGRATRYVSKNNANIARLGWLERHFPDAAILVPYRDPFAHIGSLARQHANFLEAHREDAFALRYMETIGHLEFGQALRPIDFAGWLKTASSLEPGGLDFWAEYWIHAFRAVLDKAGARTSIFSYDRLCARPEAGLSKLEAAIGLNEGALSRFSTRFRTPKTYEPPAIDADRLERLRGLVDELDRRSLF